jgi:outer membrane receptor for ferrienterochelin and colicin
MCCSKTYLLGIIFLVFSSGILAQSNPLYQTIHLPGGTYQPGELLDSISKVAVVNYQNAALLSGPVEIPSPPQSINQLLILVIDTSRFELYAKNKRILVVPIKQNTWRTLSGYVKEFGSGEHLPGVNVRVCNQSAGTTTNRYGFYSLSVPEGDSLQVEYSFIGYQSRQIIVPDSGQADIILSPVTTVLDEVVVSAQNPGLQIASPGSAMLNEAQIKSVPTLLGENDVLKVLQLLPGVQGGMEGSSGIFVRGGSPDQNLLLLDGVPVYNAAHLFGFFSVFNTDAIKHINLEKGGFSARHGGRLSSVLEIDMKEGNMREFHGMGSIGLIASRLSLEGPLIKDKASFFISGRRTYADLLLKPLWDVDGDLGYFFHDVNAKVNYRFSRKNRLYLSFYSGKDRFKYNLEDPGLISDNRMEWGNITGTMRWNHLFKDGMFGNLSLNYSKYSLSTGILEGRENELNGFDYRSEIEDRGARYDLELSFPHHHQLSIGTGMTLHSFKPQSISILNAGSGKTDTTVQNSDNIESMDLFLYAQDNWQITDEWNLKYGLHYAWYLVGNRNYSSLQPRLNLGYQASQKLTLSFTYAKMMQAVHLLTNPNVGLPTDIWVSATENISPEFSDQVTLGGIFRFSPGWSFITDIFYKDMRNLIAYKEGYGFGNTTDWQRIIESDGQGQSYGVEFMLTKTNGSTTGWIAYTLSRSDRQFSNINMGQVFPFKYDRRHDLKLAVKHRFSEKFDISANWIFNTGVAFTMPLAQYWSIDNFGQPVYTIEYSSRNELRMPAYHRLDIGLNWHKKTKWGQHTFNVSVYNLYSRLNPFAIEVRPDFENNTAELVQISLFPILPSLSYQFRF